MDLSSTSRAEVGVERWVGRVGQRFPSHIPQDLSSVRPGTYRDVGVLLRSLCSFSRHFLLEFGQRLAKTCSALKSPELN